MRVIARLDVKNNFVIKGINLEGLRKIGDPYDLAKKYYTQHVDEIIIIDLTKTLQTSTNTINTSSLHIFW